MISNFKIKPDIIIVDDQQIFRQGLKAIINYENIGSVVGEAGNGDELLALLILLRPDIVLMDIKMPQMDGFEAIRRSLKILPDLKIIVFSVYSDEMYSCEMKKMGAKGYMQKSSNINELEHAIKIVMKGGEYFQKLSIQESNLKDKPKHTESDNSMQRKRMLFFPWY